MNKVTTQALTMADLAKKAGVSKITVSRALSGHPLVKEETRERVRKIAAESGYKLNQAARNLRHRRSNTITVVIEMDPSPTRLMSEPYPLALLGGIIQELAGVNYNVTLTTLATFASAPPTADAVILLGQGVHNDAVAGIERAGLPLIVWGAVRDEIPHVVVGSDNFSGGILAAERMAVLGRRRLVFLGDTEHAEVADRFAGFVKRLADDGASLIASRPCEFSFVSGHDVMQELLNIHGDEIDGVFASNDGIAMGAIRALTEHKRVVPEDVSVIGFDDSAGAALFVPALSTIRQHWHEGGRLLARKALSLVQEETAISERMPVELIIRDS